MAELLNLGPTGTAPQSVFTKADDDARKQRYEKEVIINSAALADGYNDNPGGVLVDYNVSITHVVFRLADPAGVVGGTGNLTIQWYAGTVTVPEQTLLTTTTIAAGANNAITTLAQPYAATINTVLRAKITLGTATAGVCQIQWRGRYEF